MFKMSGVAACLLGWSSIASAQSFEVTLPAGQACRDFDLKVVSTASPHQVIKTFTDKKGDVVRMLVAGKGNTLTFVNAGTGATLTLRPNGSVAHVGYLDGSQTWKTTGHNVLILFPSDVPAGPSTTLYVGNVFFSISSTGVFTVEATSGKQTDLCAALSG